jgi:N-acetylglucosaminyldiphosphoundecaprenol N-acetyl-beta-D-mannosaminyltransferase
MKRVKLFGYPIHILTPDEGLQVVSDSIIEGQNLHIVTLNPEMIMQGEENPELGAILKSANLILPDGAGAVWALKVFGHPHVQRLPGIEFSERLLDLATENNYKVALIGARPEILEQTVTNLQQRYPGLNIAYHQHGFFDSPDHEAEVAKACAAIDPQVVLVALGVPKQEQWIAKYQPLFHGTIFAGVGGSFDVWSGMTKRAPEFYRKLNLEWFYRISSEPWRLKRIYKTLPMFVVKVILYKLGLSGPSNQHEARIKNECTTNESL